MACGSTSSERTRSAPPLRSVLVSLSAGSGAALLDRVASLPLIEPVQLALLRVAPWLAKLRPALGTRARDHLSSSVERARSLLHGADTNAIFSTRPAEHEIVEEARAMGAELIAMDRADHRMAARVTQRTRIPVLVVSDRTAQHYRRPLLAIDLGRDALPRVACALRLLAPPHAPLAFVHVYAAPLDTIASTRMSEQAARVYRGTCRQCARWHLEWFAARAKLDAERWTCHVHHGDPRIIIPTVAAEVGCDLLVLGTRVRGSFGRALLGSISCDVARAVACDVLLVPL